MSGSTDKLVNPSAPQEDVAGLFARFGGDASSYREFESKSVPASPRAVSPISPVSAVPPAAAPAPAPSSVPSPDLDTAAVVQPPPVAPRELDVLFSRLAGTPLPGTGSDTTHPLMARWRRPN